MSRLLQWGISFCAELGLRISAGLVNSVYKGIEAPAGGRFPMGSR